MQPQGYICLSVEVQLRLAIEEQNIFTYNFFQIFIHISANVIFEIIITLIVKYIYE